MQTCPAEGDEDVTAPMNDVPRIDLVVPPGAGLEEAESQASAAARHDHPEDGLALIAWWDRLEGAGGPAQACEDEAYSSIARYATYRGTTCLVRVNGGQYDFFYASFSRAAEESETETQRRPYRGARPRRAKMARDQGE